MEADVVENHSASATAGAARRGQPNYWRACAFAEETRRALLFGPVRLLFALTWTVYVGVPAGAGGASGIPPLGGVDTSRRSGHFTAHGLSSWGRGRPGQICACAARAVGHAVNGFLRGVRPDPVCGRPGSGLMLLVAAIVFVDGSARSILRVPRCSPPSRARQPSKRPGSPPLCSGLASQGVAPAPHGAPARHRRALHRSSSGAG